MLLTCRLGPVCWSVDCCPGPTTLTCPTLVRLIADRLSLICRSRVCALLAVRRVLRLVRRRLWWDLVLGGRVRLLKMVSCTMNRLGRILRLVRLVWLVVRRCRLFNYGRLLLLAARPWRPVLLWYRRAAAGGLLGRLLRLLWRVRLLFELKGRRCACLLLTSTSL